MIAYRATEPSQRLDRVGYQEQAHGLQHAGAEHAQRGEPSRITPAAEIARRLGGQRNECRGAASRDEAQRAKRSARSIPEKGGYERGQRRLVDVAPGETAAANDEIELVTEHAVAPVDPQVQHQRRYTQRQGRIGGQRGKASSRLHGEEWSGRRQQCQSGGWVDPSVVERAPDDDALDPPRESAPTPWRA